MGTSIELASQSYFARGVGRGGRGVKMPPPESLDAGTPGREGSHLNPHPHALPATRLLRVFLVPINPSGAGAGAYLPAGENL